MRTNRLKGLDTVFILGAGASYACSLPATGVPSDKTTPLDLSFNSRILSLTANAKKPWVDDSLNEIRSSWIGDLREYESLGLEESIIQRLGNYELLKVIHPVKLNGNRRVQRKVDNASYVNNLAHIIVELLSRCKQNTKKHALDFARHVYSGKHKELGKSKIDLNRIITFNYDTLLDDALLDIAKIPPKRLYFDRVKLDQNDSGNRKSRDIFPHPYLLKLHGSTNWRISSETYKKIINGEELDEAKPSIWLERKKILEPEDDISPLIMPPLPYKPITTTPIFSYLWQCLLNICMKQKEL